MAPCRAARAEELARPHPQRRSVAVALSTTRPRPSSATGSAPRRTEPGGRSFTSGPATSRGASSVAEVGALVVHDGESTEGTGRASCAAPTGPAGGDAALSQRRPAARHVGENEPRAEERVVPCPADVRAADAGEPEDAPAR